MTIKCCCVTLSVWWHGCSDDGRIYDDRVSSPFFSADPFVRGPILLLARRSTVSGFLQSRIRNHFLDTSTTSKAFSKEEWLLLSHLAPSADREFSQLFFNPCTRWVPTLVVWEWIVFVLNHLSVAIVVPHYRRLGETLKEKCSFLRRPSNHDVVRIFLGKALLRS